ncbi:MAG: 50S ribosomal protein L24 [Bacteroidetes bacterium]|nr:50S ribosomal protein L24 [Bacteroidota bacterium]
MHVKKGDKVKVISGNHKGETGEVLEIFPGKNRAIVDNINMVKKHRKPTQDKPGGIIEIPASIHLSNLMLLDPKTGEATRIGRKLVDGKLVRYAKKSGELFN